MLQDLADQLTAYGLNPTLKLALPAVRGRRDRIAAPAEATTLLDALPQPFVEEVGDYVVHSSADMTYRCRRLLDGTRVDAPARPGALLGHAR